MHSSAAVSAELAGGKKPLWSKETAGLWIFFFNYNLHALVTALVLLRWQSGLS